MLLAKPNKILVIIGGRIGDTIFCTPMLRLLKTKLNCPIDVIATKKDVQTALHKNNNIDNLYLEPDAKQLEKFNNYDVVLVPYAPYGAYDYACRLNKPFILIPKEYLAEKHIAERFVKYCAEIWKLDLTNFDYNYELYTAKENHANIINLLKQYNLDPAKDMLIGLHLGCHRLAFLEKRFWHRFYHKKVWPWRKFAKLAKRISAEYPNARIIITGMGREKLIAQKFMKKYKQAISLLDKTSLPDLLALMSYLKLYITCDSAPLHVACATTTNVIALFSDRTRHHQTGPFPAADNRISIKKAKIKDISVDEVMKVAEQFLQKQLTQTN